MKNGWMTEATLQNLPSRTNSARNYFVYEDVNPFNFPSDIAISTMSSSNCEQNSNSEFSKHKPVPQPRLKKVSKSLTFAEEPQTKTDLKPTPAPRSANSSKQCEEISESLSTSHSQTLYEGNSQSPSTCNDSNCAKYTKHKMLNKSDDSATLNISGQPLVLLSDACSEESSTDDPAQYLYSLPSIKMTTVLDSESHIVTEHLYVNDADIRKYSSSGSGSAFSVNSNVLMHNNSHCDTDDTLPADDDLYMNTNDFINVKQTVVMCTAKVEKPSPALKKVNDQQKEKDCTFNTDPLIEECIYVNINDEVAESSLEIEENDEEFYEPLWAPNENISNKHNSKSSPKQFSPMINKGDEHLNFYREKEGFTTQEKQESMVNTRNSNYFDIPPPDFAPPQLPQFSSGDDIKASFDPLVKTQMPYPFKCHVPDPVEGQMPVIPSRPNNYTLPKFANVKLDLNMSPESVTSGTHESDSRTPHPLEQCKANIYTTANYPFIDTDPFDKFSPDVCKSERGSLQKSPLKKKNTSTNALLVSPGIALSDSDNLYDYAKDQDDHNVYDSFGLKDKQELKKSEPVGGGDICRKLNLVIPPSKWNEVNKSLEALFHPGNLQDVDSDSNGSLEDILDDKADGTEDDIGNITPVEPSTPSLQRRKERSGYLYKQGGVKQNKGWEERWVIFDGKTLRYYKNSKDQVSKRIVPVSCMKDVEIDVKPTNSRQFKFKLRCTNRTFLFATDSLDECQIWSSTLMEAILHKSNDGDVPGGDMANPDLSGWIKINRNRKKYFVALKKHKMSYYQSLNDFEMACPINEIDMKLAAVKEDADRTKLLLSTHYYTFVLNFESSSDASIWKMAIDETITDALDDNRMFKEIGNNNANSFWLKYIAPGNKINEHTSNEECKKHIQEKYLDKKFCNKHLLADDKQMLNEALLGAAQTDNVMLTYQILFTDANILYHPEGKPNETAFDLAKLASQRIQMEFLMQNGGDKSMNTTENEEEQCSCRADYCTVCRTSYVSLEIKLRAEVRHQDYLLKTGPNKKDFSRRWCVLEHGYLSYYASEESKVEKDRIDNDCMLCIQTVHHDNKHPFCFEISSKKNSRQYLFCAQNEDDLVQWIQAIARVFCPIDFMEKIPSMNFCLAGYVYLKTGFQDKEWHRTWFMLENRTLIFIDKESIQRMEETDRKHDSVDLKKVLSITKIAKGMEACERSLESSYVFVLKARERLLYFQCDLARDTERMFTAVESAVKGSGDTLEDQVLTNDDIPVVIEKCITYIQHFGLTLQGIYRLGETDSKIKALLNRFHEDARSVVLKEEEHTVHLVCNVLKRFFRNLKDPLFTAHLYKDWIEAANQPDHKTKLLRYKHLLQQLPHINFLTVCFLAVHLYQLSQHSEENKMTLENISIAFGPTLMQRVNNETLPVGTADIGGSMQREMTVISDIVRYHEWLFDLKGVLSRTFLHAYKIAAAQEILSKLETKRQNNEDLMCYVYLQNPRGSSESVKINKTTTVSNVIRTLQQHKQKVTDKWCLYEIINNDLVRPLHSTMKVLPIVMEWQNWSDEYRKTACLCFKECDLQDEIDKAYDPHKILFADMKCIEKGKSKKMTFKFTQAKLSMYKDSKNVTNPVGSWNIEDLSIYKGCYPKWSTSIKFAFTFLIKGEKVGDRDHPYFGCTVSCATESDQLAWLAAMLAAQKESWDTICAQL